MRPHMKQDTSLMIVDSHLNLPEGFVWATVLTFITPEGN